MQSARDAFLDPQFQYMYVVFLEAESLWKSHLATSHAGTSAAHSKIRDASEGLSKKIASRLSRLEGC